MPVTRSPRSSIRAKNIGFAGRIKIPALIQVAVSVMTSIYKGM